jgi:hypothetical protein
MESAKEVRLVEHLSIIRDPRVVERTSHRAFMILITPLAGWTPFLPTIGSAAARSETLVTSYARFREPPSVVIPSGAQRREESPRSA